MIMPDTDANVEPEGCCLAHSHYDYGDGVENEYWRCRKCDKLWYVPIQIQRFWDDAELVISEEEE